MHEVDKGVQRIVRKGSRRLVGRRNRAFRTESISETSETTPHYFSLKTDISYNARQVPK